ncbi:hypothetical protein Dda_7578 [Drechslerella dactyloides]|uniref:Uncharacterized protein n=1 Tax=Drechslerella dactyloides TaxID=74499 RepID=A0AAD6ISG6_DREDA|nr:hypothetical protein Dda_7578 [Drechslerella dactyloides]
MAIGRVRWSTGSQTNDENGMDGAAAGVEEGGVWRKQMGWNGCSSRSGKKVTPASGFGQTNERGLTANQSLCRRGYRIRV